MFFSERLHSIGCYTDNSLPTQNRYVESDGLLGLYEIWFLPSGGAILWFSRRAISERKRMSCGNLSSSKGSSNWSCLLFRGSNIFWLGGFLWMCLSLYALRRDRGKKNNILLSDNRIGLHFCFPGGIFGGCTCRSIYKWAFTCVVCTASFWIRFLPPWVLNIDFSAHDHILYR